LNNILFRFLILILRGLSNLLKSLGKKSCGLGNVMLHSAQIHTFDIAVERLSITFKRLKDKKTKEKISKNGRNIKYANM